ncbi:hypothetical protein BH23ACT9_BH23ACT9_35490 [soil metagenome]
MRIVTETQRIVLILLVAIPSLFIILNGALQIMDARTDNPVVEFIAQAADRATYDPLTTVFDEQGELVTVALALLPHLVAFIAIMLTFRFITAAVQRADR